jgi:UDP-glucose 4-epimerase
MKILVTGGAGYIGSTVSSALIDAGHNPVILDSLINGREEFVKDRIFYKGDIADREILQQIMKEHPEIDTLIHFAALIVVPDSESNPYEYYKNNVSSSIELFKNFSDFGGKKVIFSSSASVYGNSEEQVATESSPLFPESPYARTKYIMEMVLADFCRAYGMQGIALRYFNPIGADPLMRTGAYIKNPSHVLGRLVSTALSQDEVFKITGTDWPTRDGSGIRDYIHVWDLAQAHLKAVLNFDRAFEKSEDKNYLAINLGTGRGVTVKELVAAFEKVFGKVVHKEDAPRRPGDVAGAYASCQKAQEFIDWKAQLSIEQAIADALKWEEIKKTKI